MGRRFDVILLDVDGTLLDFNRSEALGIRRLLEHFGIEPLPEYLEAYHRINEGYWKAFERGEISKKRLVTERFVSFFESLGKKADGKQKTFTAAAWTARRFSWTAPTGSAPG